MLTEHTDAVNSVAFAPDCKYLIYGSHAKTIQLWDTTSGAEVLSALEGHKGWVQSVVISRWNSDCVWLE